MSDELDELIGTVDGDQDTECQRCHCLYTLRDGQYKTKYCDQCAREIILDNDL